MVLWIAIQRTKRQFAYTEWSHTSHNYFKKHLVSFKCIEINLTTLQNAMDELTIDTGTIFTSTNDNNTMNELIH